MIVIDRRAYDSPERAHNQPRMRCIDKRRKLHELDSLDQGVYVLEDAGEHWALRAFMPDALRAPEPTERARHEDTSGPWWDRLFRRDPED